MIPGKQYTPDEIVEGAWRRRWLILLPFALILVLTMVVAHFLPDRYHSEAQLLIVPQRVPTDMVRQTVTVPLGERLQAISQGILSRTQLERIIQEFDLYPDERKRGVIMEDIVEGMRMRDVRLGPTGSSGVFSVGFDANSPKVAQAVAERLASLFIRANLEDRSNFADLTDQFLQSQLEDARRQLKAREAELETFRRENPGRMPQEFEANRQSLANTQTQLQALQESMARDRDQQLMLQRMIADASIPIAAGSAGGPALSPNEKQLESERERLRTLEARLKPGHPDIWRIQRRTIKELEGKVADEAGRAPISAGGEVETPIEAARKRRLAQLEDEMKQLHPPAGVEAGAGAGAAGRDVHLSAADGPDPRRGDAHDRADARLRNTEEDLRGSALQEPEREGLGEPRAAADRRAVQDHRPGEVSAAPDQPEPSTDQRARRRGRAAARARARRLHGYRNTSLRTEADVWQALSLPVLAIVPTMSTGSRRERRKKHQRWWWPRRGLWPCCRCVVASPGSSAAQRLDVVMYEAFYGFRERPFDLTPNPRFLLLTGKHREALSNLQYGLTSRRGLTLLVGDAGTGKTTLIRAVVQDFEKHGRGDRAT